MYNQRAEPIVTFILLCALWPAGAALGQSPSAELIARGRAQFNQYCGFCHAPDATGARGPDLVRSALVAHDVNGDLIGEIIRNGRIDKGMPAQALSADQITAIAAFLHERAHEALESSHVPQDYALEKLLTGNAQAGRAYFNGAGRCATCHSPTGDLKGVASRYPPLRLQAGMLYPRRDESQRTVTVTLASGEKLEGPLVYLDEFNVAMRDASGWYHSFPVDKVKVEVHDPLAAHRQLLDKISQQQFHDLFAYIESLK